MKIDKLSLPHPVLGLGDDVSGAYQVSSNVKLGKERITVIVNHGLANATIEKLMGNDVVAFALRSIVRKLFSGNLSHPPNRIKRSRLTRQILETKWTFVFTLRQNKLYPATPLRERTRIIRVSLLRLPRAMFWLTAEAPRLLPQNAGKNSNQFPLFS